MFKTLVNLFSKAAKKYAGYSQPSLFDELDFSSPAKDDYSSKPKHVKGNPRENHKYIERKPNPNKPGEFIYIYEMPDGSRYESEQDGEPSIRSKVIDGMFKPTDQFFSLFSRHKTPSLFDPEEPETAPKPKPVNPEPVKDLNEIVESTPEPEKDLNEKVKDRLDSKQANKTFKDLNDRVGGSRKEIAAIKLLQAEEILKLDNVTQFERINKKLVLPEFDPYARKEAGDRAGVVYMKMKLRDVITSKPANNPRARQYYVKFMPVLMEEIEKETSLAGIRTVLAKYFDVMGTFKGNKYKHELLFRKEIKDDLRQLGLDVPDSYLDKTEFTSDDVYNDKNKDVMVMPEDVFGKIFCGIAGRLTDSGKDHWKYAAKANGFLEHEIPAKIEELRRKQVGEWLGNIERYQRDLQYRFDQKDKYLTRRLYDLKLLSDEEIHVTNSWEMRSDFFRRPKEEQLKLIEEGKKRIHSNWAKMATDNDKVMEAVNSKMKDGYPITPEDWSFLPKKEEAIEGTSPEEGQIDKKKVRDTINQFPKLKRVIRKNGREVLDSEVTVENLQELFGYKSAQFGNWVKDEEAKEHLKHFIGSMKDMEDVLGIDLKKINETGGLNIAFGARGASKALAHYEPMRKIINLTKTKGDGSICHEWGHFFDHFLGGAEGELEPSRSYATEIKAKDIKIQSVVKELMDTIFNSRTLSTRTYHPDKKFRRVNSSLYYISIKSGISEEEKMVQMRAKTEELIRSSPRYSKDLPEQAAFLLKKPIEITCMGENDFLHYSKEEKNKGYWAKPVEMFARAWEAYVEDKCTEHGIYNNYLVASNSKGNADPRLAMLYPQGETREALNKVFDRLIDTTKQVYGIAKERDTDTKRVNEIIDYTGNEGNEKLFDKAVITETNSMYNKLKKLYKSQPTYIGNNKKLNQNLTEMLQKARKINYTADDYSFDFPHDFSDIKDNLFDGMEKDGLRLEPAHSNPNVRRYHKIDQSEIDKEANEHPGTFDKIQNNEISTPEELGAAIADDHKETPEKDKREAPKPENHMYGRMYKLLDSICPKPLHELEPGDNFKLKSDGYMDFNIDVLYRHEEGDLVAALSHYHEQDGDMMADPDMQILIDQKNGNIQAATFQQDGWGGGYREVFHNFPETKLINMKEKEGQNKFLKMWLKNIKDQGHKFQEPEPVGKSLYQTMRKSLKKKSNPDEEYPTYGEIEFQGLTIVVENKPGTVRSGTDPDGEKWRTKMFYPYGYIKGTKATDGEGVDVYVGKDKTSEKVFIIHQRDPENNKYDEDKVMLGFNTKEAARDAYLAHYDSYKFLGEITEMSIEQFREKLKTRKGKMIKSELSLFGKLLKALKKFTVPDWQMEFDFGGSPEEPQEGATNQKGETLLPSKVNPKVNRWQKTAATTEPIATVEAGRFFTESELRDAAKPKQPHEMTFKEYIGTQWSKEREERVLSDLQRSKTELSQIKNGTLSPSKVIGTGVSYPKKTAIEYLEQSIMESEEELKNKYADYDIRNYLYHVIRAQDAGETISPEVQQDTKLLGEKLAGIKHDEPTPKVETTVPEIKTPEPVKQPKPEVKPKKNKGGWTSKLLGLGGSHDRLEKLEPGEMSAVERHFREFNQIEFTSGSTKVKTTDDVAYMFKQLEDEAIEHAFICFINKTGEPIIQHIGTGSFDYSIVSAASIIPILANNDDIKEVYFVHNHPSGNLDISDADQLTFLRLQNIVNTYASTELKMTGLVIDGKDCKYATFDYDTSDKHSPKFTNDPSKDVKVPVVSFSKLKLKEDVYTDKITSPHQMAEVITKLRFTEGSKANIFILNAGGRVVGRFNFNTYTSATNSRKAQAREIADLIVTTGGKSAVIAIKPADGDHEINMEDTSMYNGLRTDLELVDCKLFDLIKIGNRPGLYSNVATR